MKKLMMAAAALCCMTFMMTLSSCANDDNPVEVDDNVPLAEAIKLHTAKQSLYKLDTKEVLPIYVVVDNSYEVDGQKKYYNLSNITEVKVDGTLFTADASNLEEYGYIKLIPNTDSESYAEMIELFEDYGAYSWGNGYNITIKNKKGETLNESVEVSYMNMNELNLEKTCKVADLDENGNYIVAETQGYNLFDWTFKRYADVVNAEMVYFFDAKLLEDGSLCVKTDGMPTDEGDPNKLVYTFKRYLTGSPNPMLPEGEGLMVNFRLNLELTVTE